MIQWTEQDSYDLATARKIDGQIPGVPNQYQNSLESDISVEIHIIWYRGSPTKLTLEFKAGAHRYPNFWQTPNFSSIEDAKEFAEENCVLYVIELLGKKQSGLIRCSSEILLEKVLEKDLSTIGQLDPEYLPPGIKEKYFGHIRLAEINL